jgi:AtzE family amidohydrolase
MAALARLAMQTDGASGIIEVARQVRAGALRVEEHVGRVLEGIQRRNPAINAFIGLTEARALSQAKRIDAAVAGGRDPGPLAGVTFAVKNLFDVLGLATLAGSRINRERAPATADATLITRLEAAGAVLVGTLNMDEYAFGFTTENSHYGPTRNPHDRSRIAGGSSGGSAAALAAGMVPLTLGSDTNGSIRVPASLCGVIGLKPTYGRLSRAGTFPFVASLDHVGAFARSLADLAIAYDVMQGADPHDPVCSTAAIEPVTPTLDAGIGGLRLALAGGYFEEFADASVNTCVAHAAQVLNVARKVDIPMAAEARAAAFIVTAVEGAQLHLPNLRVRPGDFDPLIRDRLLANALLPAAWYVQAQRLRSRFARVLRELFERFDAILAPATPRPATRIGQDTMTINGVETLTRPGMGLLTQPISFAGFPVVTVPVGSVDGMPVGMQIIAAPRREDLCFRVAAALERTGIVRCPVVAESAQ